MQPLRILVVDDLRDAADSLAMLIRLWGHEVDVAYSAPDALDVAAVNQPDVVLLDIGLPRMDGYEMARRLRQLPGMAQALLNAVSGFGREADIQRCKEAGIDCYFLKPADPIELHKVLMTSEELRRERRQLACQRR